MPYRAYVLTASDAASRGEREDRSGPEAERILREAGYVIAGRAVLPDERELLAAKMREICDSGVICENDAAEICHNGDAVNCGNGTNGGRGVCTVDLLVTTGGTGFSPRDCTPEATADAAERPAPGIAEAMRAASLQTTPRAMLSRATAVIRGRTLIVNLPGSPKAVGECLKAVLPALGHGLDVLRGGVQNCGDGEKGAKTGEFTHFNPAGRAHMVDVSDKPPTVRTATAAGQVRMNRNTLRLIQSGGMNKGDVPGTAQLAGIMAAKRASDWIPLCHPLPLTGVDLDIQLNEADCAVDIQATVRCTGPTGVEMEALTAVSAAALTVYDMCKAVQRDMEITGIRLLRKEGGRSGLWQREQQGTTD